MTRGKSDAPKSARRSSDPPRAYPFTQIVGQEEMRLALVLNAVEPSIGGVLITGHRGTGKSTAVRALAEVLPPFERVAGCAFNCDPDQQDELCDSCRGALESSGRLRRERVAVPVVDLPLNATEDRVCGSINIERALREGVRAFEPGLLARAHRGFLYIDEVNLLEDHLVDLLLDVSATARNRVEREGVSAEHAARFVLVGSSNPEEGELRPQLLDRFGLCAEVRTPESADERAEVVTRREAFDRDPPAFREAAARDQTALRRRLVRARRAAPGVEVPRALVRSIAELCARLGVDGHRGELTIARAARSLAAFEGRRVATVRDARRVAALALRHRLRRDPFEQAGGGGQIEQAADEVLGDAESKQRERGDARRESDERAASPENRPGAPHEQRHVASPEPQPSSSHEGHGGAGGATLPAPRVDSQIAFDESNLVGRAQSSKGARSASRRRARATATSGARGRFFGESSQSNSSGALAFDATLRATAERLTRARRAAQDSARVRVEAGSLVAAQDLRFKLFSRREGALYIFAVDTSGSMALNRIGQAKGALASLLRRSYVRRDRVALVTFREDHGDVLLRPSRAPTLARRLLDALPVGGATPLASGLRRAQEIAARAQREGAGRVALLVFTDGRANVPLERIGGEDRESLRRRIEREIEAAGGALRRAGVESVVIDTRARFASDSEGRRLARALGGSYTRLPLTVAGA